MIIVNDNDLCSCGAYWQGNGFCCNGHLKKDQKDLTKREFLKVPIDILAMPNNTFCKEMCVFGHIFDADLDTIFQIPSKGYICYDCLNKIRGGKDE